MVVSRWRAERELLFCRGSGWGHRNNTDLPVANTKNIARVKLTGNGLLPAALFVPMPRDSKIVHHLPGARWTLPYQHTPRGVGKRLKGATATAKAERYNRKADPHRLVPCPRCPSSVRADRLDKHLRRVHGLSDLPRRTTSQAHFQRAQGYSCGFCDSVFDTTRGLRMHFYHCEHAPLTVIGTLLDTQG